MSRKSSTSDCADDLDLLIRLFLAQQPILELFNDPFVLNTTASDQSASSSSALLNEAALKVSGGDSLQHVIAKPKVHLRSVQIDRDRYIPTNPPKHAALYQRIPLPDIPQLCDPKIAHAGNQTPSSEIPTGPCQDADPDTRIYPTIEPLNVKKSTSVLESSKTKSLQIADQSGIEDQNHRKLRGRADGTTADNTQMWRNIEDESMFRQLRSPLSILSTLTLDPIHKSSQHSSFALEDTYPDWLKMFH